MRTCNEPLRRVAAMRSVLLLALLMPVACATGDPPDDVGAVEEPGADEPVAGGSPDQAGETLAFRTQHMTALTDRRDIERIMSHFTDDAAYVPPGGEAVVGRDAIRAYLSDFFSGGLFGVRFDNHMARADGDLAVLRDTYDMVIVPHSGGVQTQHSGEDVWVLRRVDNEWKIALVIWTEHTPD